MVDVLDISKYIIFRYWNNGTSITNLKLQKVLYYVQGYVLKRCNEVAYPESIYRWPYGPVVPESYFEYNKFRSKPISEPSSEEMVPILKRLQRDKAMKSVIDAVINKSYKYSATQLVDSTHNEPPWRETADSEIITPACIAAFFNINDPLLLEGK